MYKNIDKILTEMTALIESNKIKLPDSLKEAMSYDKIHQKLMDLIDPRDANGDRTWRYSVQETFPGYAVVQDTIIDKTYRVDYTVDASENVTLGQWQEAEYVLQVKPGGGTEPAPSVTIVTESATSAEINFSELTPIIETQSDTEGNAFRVAVIKPGWNRTLSGELGDKYYTCKSCASLVGLLEGAKAYADHPTRSEENQRPERSIRDLVGWYSEPRQEPDGRVTANLNLLESAAWLKDILKAVAIGKAPKNFAGLSINGFGTTKIGTVDGRRGKVVESINLLRSADIVTEAGAGGEVEQILASARNPEQLIEKGEDTMEWDKVTLDDLKKNRPDLVESIGDTRLTEAKTDLQTELDTLKESVQAVQEKNQKLEEDLAAERIKITVKTKINDLLRESKLPDISQKRLASVLEIHDFSKDGAIDEAALKEAVDSIINEEREYLSKLTESGKVTGMGSGGEESNPADLLKEAQAKFDKMFGVVEKPDTQE